MELISASARAQHMSASIAASTPALPGLSIQLVAVNSELGRQARRRRRRLVQTSSLSCTVIDSHKGARTDSAARMSADYTLTAESSPASMVPIVLSLVQHLLLSIARCLVLCLFRRLRGIVETTQVSLRLVTSITVSVLVRTTTTKYV
jgi:hypothetical protein